MKKLLKNEILVIRSVAKDMISHNGFKYPAKGPVSAPDWKDDDQCGHGLHGLPWGVGGSYCASHTDNDYLWLVIRVDTSKGNYQHGTGNMGDKCKFHKGVVEFCGSNPDAVAFMLKHAPTNIRCNWSTLTAGNWSTLTAGDESTLTAGDESTLTAGNWSTLTAGYRSTLTAGYRSTLTAGDESTLTAGENTVQIIHVYRHGKLKVYTRVITKETANKWYRFEGEDWRLCTKEEIAEAEKKVNANREER
jgi:hypothetical protein